MSKHHEKNATKQDNEGAVCYSGGMVNFFEGRGLEKNYETYNRGHGYNL